MASAISAVRPLVTKLRNYGPLSAEEELTLDAAVSSIRQVDAEADMVLQGTSPNHSTLLLSGCVGRYNLTRSGGRQITSLHVPGDFVDLHSLLLKPIDHSIFALVASSIAVVPHDRLQQIIDTQPRLMRLLWLNTLIDGATHRQWSIGLGSLYSHQHLAHIICELYVRLEQIGLTDGGQFHIPLTQVLLSQCLAVSTVHTNRAVQILRSENVIRWERDLVTIMNWDKLVAIGEFDPTYLRVPARPPS